MSRCAAIKQNGERCESRITDDSGLCYAHGGGRRRRGRSVPTPGQIAREVYDVLGKLEAEDLDKGTAAVLFQGHNTLARLAKLDHEQREVAELRREVDELREAMGLSVYGRR